MLQQLIAYLEFRVRTCRGAKFSGAPFNGQERRKELVKTLFKAVRFNAIAETGTHFGTTTEYLARMTGLNVYTVECIPRYHHVARMRLRTLPNVRAFLDDSRSFLKKLAQDPSFPKEGCFFYLDAHWYSDNPLKQEITIISETWRESVLLIDDMPVPGDPGYTFDGALDIEHLYGLFDERLVFYLPSAPSSLETGRRRGCICGATKDSASEKLKRLSCLRSLNA
jgi:hypothetical protein